MQRNGRKMNKHAPLLSLTSITPPSTSTPNLHPHFLLIRPPLSIPRHYILLHHILLPKVMCTKFQWWDMDCFKGSGIDGLNLRNEHYGSVMSGML